jgi:hypothetical protein
MNSGVGVLVGINGMKILKVGVLVGSGMMINFVGMKVGSTKTPCVFVGDGNAAGSVWVGVEGIARVFTGCGVLVGMITGLSCNGQSPTSSPTGWNPTTQRQELSMDAKPLIG